MKLTRREKFLVLFFTTILSGILLFLVLAIIFGLAIIIETYLGTYFMVLRFIIVILLILYFFNKE